MLIRTAGGLRLQLFHPACARRLYSVPAPNIPTGDKQPPPLAPPPKKPKLDLRPAPIKPKPSTTPHALPKEFAAAPPPLPARPSLGAAKEEAKHALEDAEAHGILAPPPPGATWLRRTLHQAIQIAVRVPPRRVVV